MDKKDIYKSKIENLKKEIERSCRKAGRNAEDVLLIAASKYAGASQIAEVINLGISDFGENRADEFKEKYSALGDIAKSVRWHFIGHLQSRKAKVVVPISDYIHSIESISTIEEVDKQAFKIGKIQKVLVEVNISGEQSKYGMKPDEISFFIRNAFKFTNTVICGLMTMAPLSSDEVLIRNIFSRTRHLRDDMAKSSDFARVSELSMGMSNDFNIAIEEGSTMVRIGSLIFL